GGEDCTVARAAKYKNTTRGCTIRPRVRVSCYFVANDFRLCTFADFDAILSNIVHRSHASHSVILNPGSGTTLFNHHATFLISRNGGIRNSGVANKVFSNEGKGRIRPGFATNQDADAELAAIQSRI